MDMKLELVPIPVADIEVATEFYGNQVGFELDHDVTPTDGVRVVQMTPPTSGCSIVMAQGIPALRGEPGSLRGLHLIVSNIDEARDELVGRGIAVPRRTQELHGYLVWDFPSTRSQVQALTPRS